MSSVFGLGTMVAYFQQIILFANREFVKIIPLRSRLALDNQNRITLFEIIENRHGKGSVIITSQLPVSGWYE